MEGPLYLFMLSKTKSAGISQYFVIELTVFIVNIDGKVFFFKKCLTFTKGQICPWCDSSFNTSIRI